LLEPVMRFPPERKCREVLVLHLLSYSEHCLGNDLTDHQICADPTRFEIDALWCVETPTPTSPRPSCRSPYRQRQRRLQHQPLPPSPRFPQAAQVCRAPTPTALSSVRQFALNFPPHPAKSNVPYRLRRGRPRRPAELLQHRRQHARIREPDMRLPV
jgi:hypothetical protein